MVEFILLAFATTAPLLWISLVIGALGGLAQPAIQGYISRQVSDSEQGRVQGAISSLNSLVGIVGPLLATSVFAAFTGQMAWLHFPGAAFAMGAVFMASGLVLVLRALRKNDALGGVK
ncbi:MFS transporter [Deinococcus radiophilus]|uniref:MFS transporter n=1 Tax=Deinococcus radiophilus TaxID=32062 RepID=UPI002D1FA8A8|nr:MFS transporter [Deinococcus radiophilus]